MHGLQKKYHMPEDRKEKQKYDFLRWLANVN